MYWDCSPAAGFGDVLVGCSAKTQLELGRTIPAEDQMSVAIDERKCDPASSKIEFLPAGPIRNITVEADPGDAAILEANASLLNRP